jgi:hypothetical protein
MPAQASFSGFSGEGSCDNQSHLQVVKDKYQAVSQGVRSFGMRSILASM